MASRRLEYIDAMRGFTILLVVFHHLVHFGAELETRNYPPDELFVFFRMPLFFFISGFIAFKSAEYWDRTFYKARLRKKAAVQIIPAVVFFMLFALWQGDEPLEFLVDGFGKYWFTVALFEMFVIYFTVSHLLRAHSHTIDIVLIVLALLMTTGIAEDTRVGKVLMLFRLYRYFQYFVLGLLARKYADRFFRLLDDRRFNLAALALYGSSLVLLIGFDTRDTLPALGRTLAYFVAPYSGLFVVFALFYKLRNRFARCGAVSRTMQFVGRRTLDIYLLHYFFISTDMPFIDHAYPTVRTAIIGAYTLLIVAGCLLVSGFVRHSDLLGHYLFGAPRRQTT